MRYGRSEFPQSVKEAAWARCKDRCEACGASLADRRPEYDHCIPSALGGASDLSNCVVTCPPCHRLKTSTQDIPRIAKTKRIESRRANFRPKKPWAKRHKPNGQMEWR